jgi:hypothetical protein
LLLFEIIIATIGTIATLTWIGMGVLIQKAYQKYYRVINIWRCFEAIHAGLDLGSRILSKGIYRQALALQ